MIKAIKNCIKNSDYTESEKIQMLAWIECAIDFGKNLDEVAKENEQLKKENEKMKCCYLCKHCMNCAFSDVFNKHCCDKWELAK